MPDLLARLTDAALACTPPERADLLALLRTPDEEILDVVAAAYRVRREFFGRRVKLNFLVNMKSGLCPEDCGYCSQRLGSEAEVMKYRLAPTDQVVAAAGAGVSAGARRVCLVASGRGPSDREIDQVGSTIEALKDAHPDLEVCACLGLLRDGQADRLKASGADAYNHNLNTSPERYAEICSTHTYDDRVDTVAKAHGAGLSACSGIIVGMGESDDELVDLAFRLRATGADSIPVNFLVPIEGTPMSGRAPLSAHRCLRVLAMVRFAAPDTEVRASAGRELHLRTWQGTALHIANSIFLGDYLTTEGQPGLDDLRMIADCGFVVAGAEESPGGLLARRLAEATGEAGQGATAVHGCGGAGSCGGGGCGSGGGGCAGHDVSDVPPATAGDLAAATAGAPEVAPRRRGIGTDLPPNA